MSETNNNPTREEIAALAQQFWEDEGRPEGKAEEHWTRAEEQLCPRPSSQEAVQSA
jgi:hypothetical protein